MKVEHGVKPVILVVPCEVGQPLHSQGKKLTDQQRGHGAMINKISQLCLKHASKHRISVESKWRVSVVIPNYVKRVF